MNWWKRQRGWNNSYVLNVASLFLAKKQEAALLTSLVTYMADDAEESLQHGVQHTLTKRTS